MISRRFLLSCVTGKWGAAVTVCGQIPTHTIVLPPVGLAPTETAPINIMSSAADCPGWAFRFAQSRFLRWAVERQLPVASTWPWNIYRTV